MTISTGAIDRRTVERYFFLFPFLKRVKSPAAMLPGGQRRRNPIPWIGPPATMRMDKIYFIVRVTSRGCSGNFGSGLRVQIRADGRFISALESAVDDAFGAQRGIQARPQRIVVDQRTDLVLQRPRLPLDCT
jgi:hypothetical protein